ncbi:unnamed protein product [Protopolystoma xenopodis]|uniref:Uncharacterized protein n=1 Tax=Protopolystoma xenopodis TaxID=117903 RepID=A0A3S4ZWX9_9PLAT|nr:unnamed protein product [Protopolystoma xenopodis]
MSLRTHWICSHFVLSCKKAEDSAHFPRGQKFPMQPSWGCPTLGSVVTRMRLQNRVTKSMSVSGRGNAMAIESSSRHHSDLRSVCDMGRPRCSCLVSVSTSFPTGLDSRFWVKLYEAEISLV